MRWQTKRSARLWKASTAQDDPTTPKEQAERVIASAARYGQQLDDQTVLFVRIT